MRYTPSMTRLNTLIGITVVIVIAAIAVVVLPGKSTAPTETPPTGQASIPNLIEVRSPTIGARAVSPLVAEGRARGTWYFEASFPIELRDQNGATIATGYAEAQSDWMTEEFVSFVSVPLIFPAQPAGSAGTLVLHKDNPSGEPQYDQQLSIPVTF